jgi:hypothetical protein
MHITGFSVLDILVVKQQDLIIIELYTWNLLDRYFNIVNEPYLALQFPIVQYRMPTFTKERRW